MLKDNNASWRLAGGQLGLARPRIMGVLNVTPDSFSDGGAYKDVNAAVEAGMAMLDDGADIIDVGGESTRPGFTAVTPDEEAARIVPVVRELVAQGAPVSVDTRHASVAKMCMRLGARAINDVSGFTDPDMIEVAATTGAGCLVMHAGEVSDRHAALHRKSVELDMMAEARKGASARAAAVAAASDGAVVAPTSDEAEEADPSDSAGEATTRRVSAAEADRNRSREKLDEVMRRANRGIADPYVRLAGNRRFTLPDETPIMRQIMGFLRDRTRELMRAGVPQDAICIDPGAGFGKFADEDVVIQRATEKLVSMGYPVACAVSRKRLVGAVSGVGDPTQRDAATVGLALAAVARGARILRVHNVAAMAQALNSYWAISAADVRRAFVGLGSSVGDRMGYLARAVAMINAIPLTCVDSVSHAYETEPAYGIDSTVLDCVVEIRTELAPMVLLESLMQIERELGRKRIPGKENGPRTIDCDLVWMEGETHAGTRLALPHPKMAERDFVLAPMEDLMHDPARFFASAGITVMPPELRVGRVRADMGAVQWQQ